MSDVPAWILPNAALGKSTIGSKILQEADLDAAAAAAAAHYTPHREMVFFNKPLYTNIEHH